MKPVTSLITNDILEDLASRSNLRYGQEIAKSGEVNFEKSNAYHLISIVKYRNGETRTVDFLSTAKGLKWKCTCTARKDFFCKHCVAVGIALQTQKPE